MCGDDLLDYENNEPYIQNITQNVVLRVFQIIKIIKLHSKNGWIRLQSLEILYLIKNLKMSQTIDFWNSCSFYNLYTQNLTLVFLQQKNNLKIV